jgi:PIN domain nuclease of toxin-antitoxin system
MHLLLDTHTFIWYFQSDQQLPSAMADMLEDVDNSLYLSIASLWEIAIKLNIGKLTLQVPFSDLPELLERFLIETLPIEFADTAQYLSLPLHHRDPFDRMLIAQAMTNSLAIASADTAFDAYPIQRMWA